MANYIPIGSDEGLFYFNLEDLGSKGTPWKELRLYFSLAVFFEFDPVQLRFRK